MKPQPQHPPHSHKLMPITERPADLFVRGEGAWLWDAAGRRYLDWLQGWAVNALGHCPPVITRALLAQSQKLLTPSPALYNEPSLQLAARLCELTGFDQVFFGSTGAEANEGAIKLARKWGRTRRAGAFEIITFDNAFHGRNLATMAASGKAGWDQLFPPSMPGFAKARLNDIESVRALVNERTAAIMLEPVQGEAGVRPATRAFLRELRQLCDEHGMLLIFDEVQTGCGRLGELFAFQHFGVTPDILTLGKGLGGGVPISAVLAQAHCSVFERGDQGGTYAGNPLAIAASHAVLDVMAEERLHERAQVLGDRLVAHLQAHQARQPRIADVRGLGAMVAAEFVDAKGVPDADLTKRIQAAALKRGLLLLTCGVYGNVIRFLFPLTIEDSVFAEGLGILDAALAESFA